MKPKRPSPNNVFREISMPPLAPRHPGAGHRHDEWSGHWHGDGNCDNGNNQEHTTSFSRNMPSIFYFCAPIQSDKSALACKFLFRLDAKDLLCVLLKKRKSIVQLVSQS